MCPTVGMEGTPASCGDYLSLYWSRLDLRLLKLTDALLAGLQDSRWCVTLVVVEIPYLFDDSNFDEESVGTKPGERCPHSTLENIRYRSRGLAMSVACF